MNLKKFAWVLLFPLIIGGCFGSSLTKIVMADAGLNFDFEKNKRFQIILPANHTTGYEWEVKDITDDALEVIGTSYILSNKYDQDIVGAGGEEVWTFEVKEAKNSQIAMQYLRPWDKADVANEFSVTINGSPAPELLTYYGKIMATPEGAQFDDYFTAETDAEEAEEFGISPIIVDEVVNTEIEAKIVEYREKGELVEIKGQMMEDVPDYNGKQFIVHEINFIGA